MKISKTIIVATILLVSINAKAQSVSYTYRPHQKTENEIIKCLNIEKVYLNKTRLTANSLRLLENQRFEKISYSKKSKVINYTEGYYSISKKNVLYLNKYKIPKRSNYKHCDKYYLDGEELAKINESGYVDDKIKMYATTNINFFKEVNYNALRGDYAFNNKFKTQNKLPYSCSTGYLAVSKYLHNKFIETTKLFAPEFEDLVSNSYAAPENYIKEIDGTEVKWKTDTTTDFLQDMLFTVIHESIHQKTYELSSDSTSGYFINNQKTVIVKTDSIIYTYYVYDIIPDSVHLNFSVINTYMLEERISSNLDGIYGILDEFNAYYHAYEARLKLINKLNNSTDSNEIKWKNNSLKVLQNNIYNFYTFNLIIAWYLDYSKQNFPSIYEKFMKNRALREAYTLIDKGFNHVVQQFDNNINNSYYSKEYDYRQSEVVKNTIAEYEKNKKLLDDFKI